jgi:hypothetical protein
MKRKPVHVLDPAGAADGQTVVYDQTTDTVVWGTPGGGGGGVQSVVPGDGIDVDSTDPANPVVSATGLLDQEAVRDLVAAFLAEGAGVSIAHDDAGDTLTIASSGVDTEQVRDAVAAFLVEGPGVTLVHDDSSDTLTISAVLDAEVTRDTIAAALVEGPGITIDVDDAADTITISAAVTTHLVPLTTVVNGEPALVWDNDNNLVMTEVPA